MSARTTSAPAETRHTTKGLITLTVEAIYGALVRRVLRTIHRDQPCT